MAQGDFRAELLRFRDVVVSQRDALTDVINALGVALPIFGAPPPTPAVERKAALPAPAPPRPQQPAPTRTTDGSGREQKVLALLAKQGPLSPKQIGDQLNLPKWMLVVTLRNLKAKNLVTSIGQKRAARYTKV